MPGELAMPVAPPRRYHVLARIAAHEELGGKYRRMVLEAPRVAAVARPGQFIHVDCSQGWVPFWRRPFSLSGSSGDCISFIYAVVGPGTRNLAERRCGEEVDLLGPLGNGFELHPTASPLIFVGGGYGVTPFFWLLEQAAGRAVHLFHGARTASDLLRAAPNRALIPAQLQEALESFQAFSRVLAESGAEAGPEELQNIFKGLTGAATRITAVRETLQKESMAAARAVDDLTRKHHQQSGDVAGEEFEASTSGTLTGDARSARIARLRMQRDEIKARLAAPGLQPAIALDLVNQQRNVLQQLLDLLTQNVDPTTQEFILARDQIVRDLMELARISDMAFQAQIDQQKKILATNQAILDELGMGSSFEAAQEMMRQALAARLEEVLSLATAGFKKQAALLRAIDMNPERLAQLDLMERRLRELNTFTYTTDDGSFGDRGLVTDALRRRLSLPSARHAAVYACGPRPMLRAVALLAREFGVPCQVAMEELMACGVGGCFGCAVKVRGAYRLVCRDGPVFAADEVDWDEPA